MAPAQSPLATGRQGTIDARSGRVLQFLRLEASPELDTANNNAEATTTTTTALEPFLASTAKSGLRNRTNQQKLKNCSPTGNVQQKETVTLGVTTTVTSPAEPASIGSSAAHGGKAGGHSDAELGRTGSSQATNPSTTSNIRGGAATPTSGLGSGRSGCYNPWNAFFYARTRDIGIAIALRRAYAVTVFMNAYMLSLDWDFVVQAVTSPAGRETIDPDTWTILGSVVPDAYHRYCLYVWMMHALMMGCGIAPRFQAACIFFWINQFAAHNNLLWDGEDNVMRLLAFFLIFFPPNQNKIKSWPMWPFRLMQWQMCLIFFSSGGLKVSGESWQNGTAMYTVVQGQVLYGGYFNPSWLLQYTRPLTLLTYLTLVVEMGSIITLWFRKTRLPTLIVVWMFHLGIDATMNLNFFHWIMMVGWSSFLIQPSHDDQDVGATNNQETVAVASSLSSFTRALLRWLRNQLKRRGQGDHSHAD
ncbi:hypothetical protein ACA910_001836 [Epithemia clementina (nom. ined.)]